MAGQPSLLPGRDVATLVTHTARNADGLAEVASGAAIRERRCRYATPEARDAGIEAGRSRPGGGDLPEIRPWDW